MVSLREKQKAHRRELIEKAAGELFVEKSFDDTAIDEIAERALVSPATVYNYYGSKGELLLALVARGEVGIKERRDSFLKLAKVESPVNLITDVIMSNVEDTLTALSKELWGHVVAYIATTSDPDVASRYLDTIMGGLAKAIKQVIDYFVEKGIITAEIDSTYVAFLLTRIERNHFLTYIYLDDFSLSDFREALHKDVDFIIGNQLI